MDAAQTQKVVAALLEGPRAAGHRTELWTLPRVRLLIGKITGVRSHPGHVWRVLGALGFSYQRPERVRTWALRGQTPLRHESFGWKKSRDLWP